MSLYKDAWLKAHESLVEEYLEAHPGLSWDAAYEITASMVDERAADMHAAQIDQARMEAKYEQK